VRGKGTVAFGAGKSAKCHGLKFDPEFQCGGILLPYAALVLPPLELEGVSKPRGSTRLDSTFDHERGAGPTLLDLADMTDVIADSI
jgi:hypothetical protein